MPSGLGAVVSPPTAVWPGVAREVHRYASTIIHPRFPCCCPRIYRRSSLFPSPPGPGTVLPFTLTPQLMSAITAIPSSPSPRHAATVAAAAVAAQPTCGPGALAALEQLLSDAPGVLLLGRRQAADDVAQHNAAAAGSSNSSSSSVMTHSRENAAAAADLVTGSRTSLGERRLVLYEAVKAVFAWLGSQQRGAPCRGGRRGGSSSVAGSSKGSRHDSSSSSSSSGGEAAGVVDGALGVLADGTCVRQQVVRYTGWYLQMGTVCVDGLRRLSEEAVADLRAAVWQWLLSTVASSMEGGARVYLNGLP